MDYLTKPTSRLKLRVHSMLFRKMFKVPLTGKFPVMEVLERLPDVLENCRYLVVDDKDLPAQTMCWCYANGDGGFDIEIKESVYDGALKGNGAFRGFICHEICHLYLFFKGFTPVFERAFEDHKIPAYRSVEWQAKALCGEVMIPYEESRGMSLSDLVEKYGVSQAFATHRRRADKNEKK